jgi:hypothetical protein
MILLETAFSGKKLPAVATETVRRKEKIEFSKIFSVWLLTNQ